MTVVVSPSFATVEEAIDWLERAGCSRFVLWRGSDGLVRGNGVRWIRVSTGS